MSFAEPDLPKLADPEYMKNPASAPSKVVKEPVLMATAGALGTEKTGKRSKKKKHSKSKKHKADKSGGRHKKTMATWWCLRHLRSLTRRLSLNTAT